MRKDKLLLLYESDPDLKEMAEDYKNYLKKKKAGLFKTPKKHECKRLKDLCLLVFKKVHLNGECQMLEQDGFIKTWVWNGYEFRDKLIDLVEETVPQLSDTDELDELRLVATKVSKDGVERLHRIFPNAEINCYSVDDDHADWRVSQAKYKLSKDASARAGHAVWLCL